MKFFVIAALIATASTLRLRAEKKTGLDAVEADIKAMVKDHYSENDHLTVNQVLTGLEKVGKKHCANGNIPAEYCTDAMAKKAEKHIRKAFKEADANGDGKLTLPELKAAVEAEGSSD